MVHEGESVGQCDKDISLTRKKKPFEMERHLFGTLLKVGAEDKYQGLILDSKLIFNSHSEKITNKTTRALWACWRMFGKN